MSHVGAWKQTTFCYSRRFDDNRRVRIPAWIIGAVAGLTICSSASTGRGQQDAGALEILQLRRNFYLLATPISNVGVQIGSDGVVVVNAGTLDNSAELLSAI